MSRSQFPGSALPRRGSDGQRPLRGRSNQRTSQYVSHDFQAEIRFLGIEGSPAFVREPEGNGCAERFIRTLKENLLWVRRFDTIEELRRALIAFQRLYNETWILERHGYRTPATVRADQFGALATAA
jgi:putative transposase